MIVSAPKDEGIATGREDQRPGLPPTNSPFLMTTMRRAATRFLAGSLWLVFLVGAAVLPLTTTRLRSSVWFMTIPVQVMLPVLVYE